MIDFTKPMHSVGTNHPVRYASPFNSRGHGPCHLVILDNGTHDEPLLVDTKGRVLGSSTHTTIINDHPDRYVDIYDDYAFSPPRLYADPPKTPSFISPKSVRTTLRITSNGVFRHETD